MRTHFLYITENAQMNENTSKLVSWTLAIWDVPLKWKSNTDNLFSFTRLFALFAVTKSATIQIDYELIDWLRIENVLLISAYVKVHSFLWDVKTKK